MASPIEGPHIEMVNTGQSYLLIYAIAGFRNATQPITLTNEYGCRMQLKFENHTLLKSWYIAISCLDKSCFLLPLDKTTGIFHSTSKCVYMYICWTILELFSFIRCFLSLWLFSKKLSKADVLLAMPSYDGWLRHKWNSIWFNCLCHSILLY